MPESATLPNASNSGVVTRLGSFEAGLRVFDRRSTNEPVATVEVTGTPGTSVSGTKGFASCTVLPSSHPEHVQDVESVLGRVRMLAGPTLVPILETGVADRIAFVIEATVSGERLSNRLERQGTLAPRVVANVIDDVATALEAAHRIDLFHGAIDPFSVWIDERNRCLLGGFGLAGRSAKLDIEQLARLAIELLAAKPLEVPPNGSVSADRIRGHVNGLTERVALTISRGFLASDAGGYASAPELSSSFREAVKGSALDLVAGAWEAISRGDQPMAELLVEMVARYDPAVEEMPLLRLRLSQNGLMDPGSAAARLMEAGNAIPSVYAGALPVVQDNVHTSHPGSEDLAEISPEIRRMLSGPEFEPAPKSRMNYWVLFAAGVFAMVIIMVVLVALTFTST